MNKIRADFNSQKDEVVYRQSTFSKVCEELNIMKINDKFQRKELQNMSVEIKSLRELVIGTIRILYCRLLNQTLTKKVMKNSLKRWKIFYSLSLLYRHRRFFMNNDPVTKWSTDDIASALAFRAVSSNIYNYVRQQLKYPFPSITTLKRWTKGHTFQQGLLDIVLTVMRKKCQSMTEAERAYTVSFDEMKVTKSWEFRRSDEIVLSPHNYVQVLMVRGNIVCWKQIVYYDFDTKITYDLLQTIINAVEEKDMKFMPQCVTWEVQTTVY